MLQSTRLKQPATKINSATSATSRHIAEKISPVGDKEIAWSSANMGSQKVHFNATNKRNNRNIVSHASSDPITQQHEENISALFDEWNSVKQELNHPEKESETRRCITQYIERNPNPKLQNFRPFDLEEFWGQKQLKIVNK
uniref:Protein FAM195A-like n=1 Tax=Phallusia mammillata TaxID=59560 RepID=A0A6F9DL62_9ASCI|nr:protein FAM195A-like [Phallusia mammillata]